jgi:diketogulonate reductase-like aldo/keto reductase
MSYGNKGWADWVLEEKESIEHFKLAYEVRFSSRKLDFSPLLTPCTSRNAPGNARQLGINSWDTANVYSNGDSEKIVGKAIKELKIPRETLVILTKVWCVHFVSSLASSD